MQQRRFRPGDVVDDYCPRERRITDHAVVAMIDDTVKQTRCCVCDAEHEYKDGKIPAQRRKKPQAALFTQVLEGLQGPQSARLAQPGVDGELDTFPDPAATLNLPSLPSQAQAAVLPAADRARGVGNGSAGSADTLVAPVPGPSRCDDDAPLAATVDEGPVRRSLIRATLPRPEGQPPPARVLPDFTIRQPTNARAGRPGPRRRGGPQEQGHIGPMRFGRGGGQGQGQGHGHGHGPGHGQRQHQQGNRNQGPTGGRSSRRGGKKG